MRRINASRPISGRRATRRRRRAIAPAVPPDYRRVPLRTHFFRLTAKARAHALGLLQLSRRALDALKSIPFGAAWRHAADVAYAAYRHVANRTRTAYSALWGRLTAGLALAHNRMALTAAALRRARDRVRRGISGIRLPEIPGGDPVVFGAAVGVAVIVGAGLVVLIATELMRDSRESQTVAELYDRDRPSEDWLSMAPAGHDGPGGDIEMEIPQTVSGLVGGVAEPAPVVAWDGVLADQNEDLAAAQPLLDVPAGQHRDLALRPPERPPVPVLPPRQETGPPVPAARPQWLANAVQTRHRPGKNPMIAIVIDDAGVAQARTARALELPPPLTIAFIPYGGNLKQQTRKARQNGHELLLHIPMEAGSSTVDPGPNALLTSLDGDEIMQRFRWALSRFDGYVGVNNHMGSKFMARADLVEPLLAEMNARGLMFLDSRTDRTTVGADLARGMELPHASRQVFLDNDLDADRIAAQLAELERVARRRGHAIAIGHPHDVTVDVLAKWIPDARARGFDLVPVSAIVKLEYGGSEGSQLAAAAGGGEANGLLGGTQ